MVDGEERLDLFWGEQSMYVYYIYRCGLKSWGGFCTVTVGILSDVDNRKRLQLDRVIKERTERRYGE